jgi:sugar-specific transcriptional regulator TrmB
LGAKFIDLGLVEIKVVTMGDEQKQMVRIEAIAQMSYYSVEQLYRLTKSGVIKNYSVDGETGKMYPFVETIQALFRYKNELIEKKDETSEAIKKAELAKKELEVRSIETKVSLEESKAHSTDDVKRVWNDIIGTFKHRLLSVPDAWADEIVSLQSRGEARGILRDKVTDLCTLLRDYDPAAFYAKYPDCGEVEFSGDDGEA